LILQDRLDEGVDLAREFGRSLVACGHRDLRAVRLLDDDRLVTDIVNDGLPLNRHGTLHDKAPAAGEKPLGPERIRRVGTVSPLPPRQRAVKDSVPAALRI
jgi:hypothetical protein